MVLSVAKPGIELDRILADAQLPALPQSAMRLLDLSQNPRNGPAEFAVPIESDPGLAGQVLKFVNSAYFGFAREISSVKLAITLVGIRTIKNFALWSAVFNLMPNPKCGALDLKGLWQDSLRRGLIARAYGKLLGLREAEDVFAGALLQDMAVPLLAKALAPVYARFLEMRKGGELRLSQIERNSFGWTHADAAARMARNWNLPEEFAQLVAQHISLDELMANAKAPPAQLAVALSSLAPALCDESWRDAAALERAHDRLRPPGGPTLAEFLAAIDQEFRDFAPILQVSDPGRSLVDSYQEAVHGVA